VAVSGPTEATGAGSCVFISVQARAPTVKREHPWLPTSARICVGPQKAKRNSTRHLSPQTRNQDPIKFTQKDAPCCLGPIREEDEEENADDICRGA